MSDHKDELDRLAVRRKAFRAALREQPVVSITGVVSRLGSARTWLEKEDPGALVFTLDPWRADDGPMERRPLRVTAAAHFWAPLQRWFPPRAEEIVRFRARIAIDDEGRAEGVLLWFYGRWLKTRKMVVARLVARHPVVVQDAVLGTLELDRERAAFSGRPLWEGAPIALHLRTDDGVAWDNGAISAHASAMTFWADRAGWLERLKTYAADQLLKIRNEGWADEDGAAPLSADAFKARLRLTGLEFMGNRQFNASFDDGDLFWGVVIVVGGDLNDGPSYVDMEG